MKKLVLAIFITTGISYGQTCEGMFNVYDSCYDINNCDDGYYAMQSLINSLELKNSKKFASICKSSCENKKAGIKKMSKDEFMSIVCPIEKKKQEIKSANPSGNNQ